MELFSESAFPTQGRQCRNCTLLVWDLKSILFLAETLPVFYIYCVRAVFDQRCIPSKYPRPILSVDTQGGVNPQCVCTINTKQWKKPCEGKVST